MCHEAAVNGHEYAICDVVITAIGFNDADTFFDIMSILILNREVWFVGKQLRTLFIENNFNAYVVERFLSAIHSVLPQKGQLDESALSVLQSFSNGKLYILQMHWVCGHYMLFARGV